MNEDSVFTKIIKREIPAEIIYEDDQTIAFLEVHPDQPGHTLVVPKKQIDQLWDLDDNTYRAVMATCKKVALRLKEITGKHRVGIKLVGIHVPHAHVHLVPFDTAEQYYSVADHDQAIDFEALKTMAAKLRF